MALVRLDGAVIDGWPAFHRQSHAAFGFPDFYGNNLDAWIDCLSSLRDDDGMTRFTLGPAELLEIELINSEVLRRRAPAILPAIEDCVAEVNARCTEQGEAPVLALRLR